MSAPRLPGIGEANSQRAESAIRQIAMQLQNEYAPLADPVFTGDPQAPTPATSDNDTSVATTAYVKANLASYAPLASPALTGNPTAPTPTAGDNDTSVATTAFVATAISAAAYSPPAIADKRIMANISGVSAAPSASELSAILDSILGTTQGAIVYRGASAWAKLDPGTSGQFLQTQGAAANPQWATVQQPTTSVLKTANTARNTSIILTDDPDLVLAVEANTVYLAECAVFYTASGGNIIMAIDGPSGATALIIEENGFGTGAGAAAVLGGSTGDAGLNSTSGKQATGFRGYISTGSTAGNAVVQWNRGNATGTTTVLAGSWFRLTKV